MPYPVPNVELDDFQARFARVVRRRRLLARLNQEQLADKAGLHRTHVSVLERQAQVPSMAAVLKLATALGTTLTELFREVEAEAPPGDEPPPIPKGRPPKDRPGRGRKPGSS
ncbi:MAG: hypothetical protein C0501_31205 [Isosphaera sp.]|nr:hypothetical protein [Isosphaera sp.]